MRRQFDWARGYKSTILNRISDFWTSEIVSTSWYGRLPVAMKESFPSERPCPAAPQMNKQEAI